MLRLLTADEQLDATLMDDILTSTPPWALDKSPRWAVNWQQIPLTDAPASQRSPADYRQRDESPLGFDEKALPILPDSSETGGSSVRSAARSAVIGRRSLTPI